MLIEVGFQFNRVYLVRERGSDQAKNYRDHCTHPATHISAGSTTLHGIRQQEQRQNRSSRGATGGWRKFYLWSLTRTAVSVHLRYV